MYLLTYRLSHKTLPICSFVKTLEWKRIFCQSLSITVIHPRGYVIVSLAGAHSSLVNWEITLICWSNTYLLNSQYCPCVWDTKLFFFNLKSWLLSLSGITVCLLSPWLGLGQISNKGSKGVAFVMVQTAFVVQPCFSRKGIRPCLDFWWLNWENPPPAEFVCVVLSLTSFLSLTHTYARVHADTHASC